VPNFIAHAKYQGFVQNFGSTTEAFLKESGVLK
jgi:putative tricarboxylic transport membrane protein